MKAPTDPIAAEQASHQGPVVIRCDGSPQLGLGHVTRCLALAHEFRAQGWLVVFAMRDGPLGAQRVKREGFSVLMNGKGERGTDSGRWLLDLCLEADAAAVVVDVRDDLKADALGLLRERGVVVAVIDDCSDRRLQSDLAFYPPVPQVSTLDWSGFEGQWYAGWEWVLLGRKFRRASNRRDSSLPPTVLVTMGASDPANLTVGVLEELKPLAPPVHIVVVIGPGFLHWEALDRLLREPKSTLRVIVDPPDMQQVMAASDVGVASFGMTAYELAAAGVPAIHLALTADHARSSELFEREGMAIALGDWVTVGNRCILTSLQQLLADENHRHHMGERCRRAIDGQGARRIGATVLHVMRVGTG